MDQRSRNRSVSLSSDEALNGPLRGSGTSRAGGSSTTNVTVESTVQRGAPLLL
ncbi:hypothetical protein ERO13_A11G026232v2 [Gossypium hirsutum]|nr:hypothetical protein ERO13_A11G026232v2 [Gossypium hirsutum]